MKQLNIEEQYALLIAGEKYAGENYLTETWAWILRNNKSLLNSFLKEVFEVDVTGEQLEVTTQKYISSGSGKGFIDLTITTLNYCFIFEHKINHSFGEDQILKYIEWAKKKGYSSEKIMAATVSGYFIDHDETVGDSNLILVNYLWHDLYKFIDEKNNEKTFSESEVFVLKCFQNLLIKNDLTWIETEVSMEGLKNYYSALSVNKSLRDIFSQIKDHYKWEKVYKVFQRVDGKNHPPKTAGERWGRIGIDLDIVRGWTPSLFFGVLADPIDHKVVPSNPEIGPDLCLIVDIDKSRFRDYDISNEYKKLETEMQSWAERNKNEWSFYNHLEDAGSEANLWHPLYLRKPLYSILHGADSPEGQRKKIEDEMTLLLDAMFKETSFLEMREIFKTK